MRWVLVMIAVMAPQVASAEPYRFGGQPAWFVTGGATTGGTVATEGRGAYVGGELSLVRVREARFAGLYVDGYYDWGADGTYLTFGPELGLIRRSRMFPMSIGVDGGGALRFADDTALGATGRVFVSFLGTFSVYGRYVYLDLDEGGEHVVQVGVTLKFPLGRAL
jgi:hypothetical protein